ncbi:MAG: alpha/beta hydrolase, partial [Gemmatimonadota bacterium]
MNGPRDEPLPNFRPAPGLANPHLQTLMGRALRPDLRVPLRRERLETPDGDFLDIDFAGGADEVDRDAPLVVVLHGLEGRTTRKYMRTTFQALLDRGIRPVGMNFRGCSGEPNRQARAYHSGETGDLRFVLETLAARHDVPYGVMGYSLGGNVTLKFLGESGGAAAGLVAAGAAVSVPFD